MKNEKVLITQAVKKEAEKFFGNEFSGHDVLHTMRVLENAKRLQALHGGDLFIISLSALLHDFDDKKISPETHKNLDNARAVLMKYSVEKQDTEHILNIIRSVSFSDGEAAQSLEAKIVQDADRLDALGAVGIARCFAWGGCHGRPIYSEKDSDSAYIETGNSGIAHFFQKLLKLESMMNTDGGRKEAKKRTDFLKEYLSHFSEETGISFDFSIT